jgi:putative nucleotidyltransferase with HDIG domain
MPLTNEKVEVRVDRNLDLPSVPVVLSRILEVMDDDTTSARQLEEIILHDPSLSARILKLANSAFYSFESEVKTISRAIPLLGFNLVRSLAIGVTVFESFLRGNRNEAGLINRLWMHSIGVGMLARDIWVPRADRSHGEFAMLCGLLHDMGKVVLFKKDAAHYSRLFTSKQEITEEDIRAIEVQTYGFDHAALGATLARQWKLPPELGRVVELHHEPLSEDTPALVAAVALADIMVRDAGLGQDGDATTPDVAQTLVAHLGLSSNEYENLGSSLESKRQEIEKFFRMAS